MSSTSFMAELNDQQHQAATTTAQNCLVLAGAGCGKTKTIVARAAYLISQGIPANQIQILTFTRRAASEIVTRVEQYLGTSAQGLRASTFHTFCMYLLRRNRQAFGLENFSIIDRDDQIMIFRLLRGKDNILPKAAELCDIYSFARNTQCKLSVAIEKVLPEAMEFKSEIAEVMKTYEQRKQERSFLDYDDILSIVAVNLQSSPTLVHWVSQFCRVFLVDEMQDTNPLQWALLSPFIGKSQLFCVGDDAQSIYGFRGADFENIHYFKDNVSNAVIYTLEKNYRSTQGILDLSNWLLDVSPIQYDKHLIAAKSQNSRPHFHIFSNEFEEANWIAQDLIIRKKQNNVHWNDHMVLVRSGYAARHIERALINMSVPYQFIGGTKLLESAHVKDLLSMLRVVSNTQDDIAWMRFLTLWDGIGDVGASKLAVNLIKCQTLEECCNHLEHHGRVPQHVLLILKQMSVLTDTVVACIELAFEALHEQLAAKYQKQDWSRREKDFKLVKQLAQKHAQISEFLEAYVLDPISTSEVEQSADHDIVTLITIHSAKGTERKVCYVPHLTVNQYPHARAQGDFDAVEEERRVLYVALTRAQNELVLTKQDLTTWAMDQIDDQGRPVSSYFFNQVPSHLLDVTIHKRDEFFENKKKPIKKISFGIDLD
ncbi:ATP-dependent helicase [Acinetobacter pollinis]|uniref:ATP-dependent helicase n=1 Tax=Acinetobacter pollinis TaxID=2605270 RepID=UPI0018C213D6|nr:ATP-dependent helicase [Acinetobacter pollinis]MBF7692224.1 UvrD-helicase domain-containing protein [Acinetobacter pollinis]MBF7700219.1 UvrD-helicase domain-containing protein [Acinetobacter pollinis]